MPSPLPTDWLRGTESLCHAADGFWAFVDRPRVLSVSELRSLDTDAEQRLGIPPAVLMENAALHAASILARLSPRGVLIIAGTGNNGGDGFALARQLAARGVRTHAVLAGNPARLSPCADMNRRAAIALGLADQVSDADTASGAVTVRADPLGHLLSSGEWDTVVDALFGTGLSRPPTGPAADVIERINTSRASGSHRVTASLDVPSGLNADTGRASGPVVRADVTITFAASKVGFANIDAQHALGEIMLVPIGLPEAFVARFGAPITIEPGANWRETHHNSADTPLTSRLVGRDGGREKGQGAGRGAQRTDPKQSNP